MNDREIRARQKKYLLHIYENIFPNLHIDIKFRTNNGKGHKYKLQSGSGEVDRIGFGSHVDRASKLLIDSALFPELREGGVSCSCGKVFVWSCVTQCKDPETPVLICSSRSPSRLHIIKIIPQPSTKSLFVTWLAWLSSVKSSPITVSGTMVYSKDHSPWLVWREWFVNHYSAACRERNTWGMQITCHQIDSCAAKSDKLQLLLSQIGFFPLSERLPSPVFSGFLALTKRVLFFCLLLVRHRLPPYCSGSQTSTQHTYIVWTEREILGYGS